MKSKHQQQVEEFMRVGEQEVPEVPTKPDFETRKLRAQLIMEEAIETIDALGIIAFPKSSMNCLEFNDLEFVDLRRDDEIDLIKIIDGCCDIAVVTTGTLSACGIPDKPFQDIVNRANLAKFPNGEVIKNEDGKIQKPVGWQPPEPQIEELLNELKG